MAGAATMHPETSNSGMSLSAPVTARSVPMIRAVMVRRATNLELKFTTWILRRRVAGIVNAFIASVSNQGKQRNGCRPVGYSLMQSLSSA